MSLHSLVATGGRVVVIGGRMNRQWERWANDPRIEFWTGDRSEIERHLNKGNQNLPTNAHGVILSRFISHAVTTRIMEEARRRRLIIMGPKNDGEVTKLLEEITGDEKPLESLPPLVSKPPEKPLRPPKRGEMNKWAMGYDDASKSIKEAAELVWIKMRQAGIETTSNSVQQAIGNMRRKAGVFAHAKMFKPPKEEKVVTPPQAPSIPPTPERVKAVDQYPDRPSTVALAPAPEPPKKENVGPKDQDNGTIVLMNMIDDLMAGLSLLQDQVKKMHEQNKEYRMLEIKLSELGFIKK